MVEGVHGMDRLRSLKRWLFEIFGERALGKFTAVWKGTVLPNGLTPSREYCFNWFLGNMHT